MRGSCATPCAIWGKPRPCHLTGAMAERSAPSPSSRFPPTGGARPRPAAGGLRRVPGDPHGAGHWSPAGRRDERHVAALRAACAAPPSPKRSGQLRVAVADHDDPAWRQPRAKLTVIVAVVDGRSPHVVGHDAHKRHGARGLGRRGDRRATGRRRSRRRRRRPPDRRNPRCGPGPGRPHDRPRSAAGTPGRTENADAPDRHDNGDQTVTDEGKRTVTPLIRQRRQSLPPPHGRRNRIVPSQDDDLTGRLWAFGGPHRRRGPTRRAISPPASPAWDSSGRRCGAAMVLVHHRRGRVADRPRCLQGVPPLLPGLRHRSCSRTILSSRASDAVLDDQAIAQSRTVAGAALRKLGLQQSPGISSATTQSAVLTNRILLITVKATS